MAPEKHTNLWALGPASPLERRDFGRSVRSYSQDYGHLPPRFVPHVVRAEWAWIPTSRAAATVALVVC